MVWDHQNTTLDGTPIYKPGTLIRADLTKYMLIDSERYVIDPDTWLKTDAHILEFGPNPVVIILDLDFLEIHYQILLGEKKFWFPVIHTSGLKSEI